MAEETTKSKRKRVTFGNVCTREDNSGTYIYVTADVTLKKGQYVNVDTPEEKVAFLLSKGIITEEEAAKKRAGNESHPWVKYVLSAFQE